MDKIQRLARVVRAIEDQKQYISRVPDPDNRSTAESNLSCLVEWREQLCHELSASSDRREYTAGSLGFAAAI